MMSDTLYGILHILLVDKSLQFNLYRIHNILLVHLILKSHFGYSIQEEYHPVRLDSQYILFLQDKERINKFCILSMINQTQDEAFNINDNFWEISTLQDNKKLYITCLQYSYSINLCFLMI